MSIETTLLASLVVFVGAFVQTSIGFGFAIVTAPLLFFLNPAYVPVPITIATLANVTFNSWHFRSHLSLRGLAPAAIARLPGSIVGAWLLMTVSVKILAIFIAAIIVAGMAVNYIRFRLPYNRFSLAIAGFISGIMGTATSIGGPPMAIVMQGQPANAIRGNLSAFFLFGCAVNLIVLLPSEYFRWRELLLGLPLLPAALFGSYIASRWSEKINDRLITFTTLGLCGFAVAAMLIQQLGSG